MDRQRFEQGIQRLYYVAWVLFSISFSAAFLEQTTKGAYSIGLMEALFGVVMVAGIVLAPGAVMLTVRWVYRGFVPK